MFTNTSQENEKLCTMPTTLLLARLTGRLKLLAWAPPTLVLLVLFSLSCLMLSLLGLGFDHRYINGELAWIKPCKFSISLALYGASLIWLSRFLTAHKRLWQITCYGALMGSVIEITAIVIQVLRGTTSHFNTATPLDAALYFAITAAIMPVALALLCIFIMLLGQRSLPPVLGLAIRWGLFLTLVGLIPGILMLLPDQLQDVVTAHQQFDGHTIGYPEGGPGLPWLGWSTVAGDLRVAHFVGLHALQILPLIGFVVSTVLQNISQSKQKALVLIAGFSYLACICLLTWQALHAESIVAPSVQTLSLSFILFAITCLAGTFILLPLGLPTRKTQALNSSFFQWQTKPNRAVLEPPLQRHPYADAPPTRCQHLFFRRLNLGKWNNHPEM